MAALSKKESDDVRARAVLALKASVRGDHPAVAKHCNAIAERYGAPGIVHMMQAWIGTAMVTMGFTSIESAPTFMDVDTGHRTDDVDTIPAPAAWTYKLIRAYMNKDHQEFVALIFSIEPADQAKHLDTLLTCLTVNLQAYVTAQQK